LATDPPRRPRARVDRAPYEGDDSY
jgi:hypothetical protein